MLVTIEAVREARPNLPVDITDERVRVAIEYAQQRVDLFTCTVWEPYEGVRAVHVDEDLIGVPDQPVSMVRQARWADGTDVPLTAVTVQPAYGERGPRVRVTSRPKSVSRRGWDDLVAGAEQEHYWNRTGVFRERQGGWDWPGDPEDYWLLLAATWGRQGPVPAVVQAALLELVLAVVDAWTAGEAVPGAEDTDLDGFDMRGVRTLTAGGYTVSWAPGMEPGVGTPEEAAQRSTGVPSVDSLLTPYRACGR